MLNNVKSIKGKVDSYFGLETVSDQIWFYGILSASFLFGALNLSVLFSL